MSTTPRISVVVPCYNAAAFLPRTLNSIAAQELPPHEVILVDDGSSDNSVAVARREYAGIHVICQANKGPSAARNAGWRAATETHIAFLDADDTWLPIHLVNAATCFQRHRDLRWYASAWAVRERDTRTLTRVCCRRSHIRRSRFDYFRVKQRGSYPFVSTDCVVVEHALLEQAGGFEESFRRGEDIELWARLAVVAPSIGYNRHVGAIYQRQGQSLTLQERVPEYAPNRIVPFYRCIQSHLMAAPNLLPKQRRRWFRPLARTMIRRIALRRDVESARTLRRELSDILTHSQRWILKSVVKQPERMEAWYRRGSVLRGLIGV